MSGLGLAEGTRRTREPEPTPAPPPLCAPPLRKHVPTYHIASLIITTKPLSFYYNNIREVTRLTRGWSYFLYMELFRDVGVGCAPPPACLEIQRTYIPSLYEKVGTEGR